jgi:hypothetical protein
MPYLLRYRLVVFAPAERQVAVGGACRRAGGLATVATSRALVRRPCRLGDTVELRTHQGVGHFDVIEVASTDMVGWTGERLAGRPARSTCRG